MIDYEHEITTLKRELEEVRAERDNLRTAIADATEKLGHEGCDPTDIFDAVCIIERLLDGKEVGCGNDYVGMAKQVEDLMLRARGETQS